jgi:hypothetical protein
VDLTAVEVARHRGARGAGAGARSEPSADRGGGRGSNRRGPNDCGAGGRAGGGEMKKNSSARV